LSELKEKITNALRINLLQAGVSSYEIDKILPQIAEDIITIITKDLNNEYK
jgi:hypothetical protein